MARISQNPIIKKLSSVKITVVCLSLLFILTFWGTVAQVDQGLYVAQQRYFHSFYFLAAGFIPFPGAQLVLWILFVNLVGVTISRFYYYRKPGQTGLLVIHFGLLLYFFGAFVTYLLTEESYVQLLEGEATNVSASYHDWEISAYKGEDPEKKVVAFQASNLLKGKGVTYEPWQISISAINFYRNAAAYQGSPENDPVKWLNDSGIGFIKEEPLDKERENNVAGGYFRVSWKGQDYNVILYGHEDKPLLLKDAQEELKLILRNKRSQLPFMLKLVDFRAEFHPNTEIAKSFESTVQVLTDDSKREIVISMNKPLRHKSYTFYQSSYMIDQLGREYSIFATVKNTGRLLPYIASFVVFGGLVIHFLLIALKSRRRS